MGNERKRRKGAVNVRTAQAKLFLRICHPIQYAEGPSGKAARKHTAFHCRNEAEDGTQDAGRPIPNGCWHPS